MSKSLRYSIVSLYSSAAVAYLYELKVFYEQVLSNAALLYTIATLPLRYSRVPLRERLSLILIPRALLRRKGTLERRYATFHSKPYSVYSGVAIVA